MNTENEKVVRALFEQWWNDNCAYKTIFNYGYETIGQDIAYHAFKAALQSQVSNTDGWVPRGSVMSFLEAGTRYKIASHKEGGAIFGLPKALAGCWVALVPADDDMHLLSAAPKAPQQVSNTPQDGKPVAWIRFTSDDGYEGPIMDCDKRMDGRRESGVWTPLYCTPPQQQEQSVEAVDAYNLHCETCNGHGFVTYSIRRGESDFEEFEQECPVCDGAGKAPKHVQDLQARYQEVRSELHALNMEIGMESLLGPSPATPTATASQESAPGQEAIGYIPKSYQWFYEKYGQTVVTPSQDRNAESVPVYLVPPTSTAIAAMVIKQAAAIASKKQKFAEDILGSDDIGESESDAWKADAFTCKTIAREILALNTANAEAELEALMMKAVNMAYENAARIFELDTADEEQDELRAIVQSVIRKG